MRYQPSHEIAERMFSAVEAETGVTRDMIQSDNRKRELVTARQITATLLYTLTSYTLETVGAVINRDHASILYYRNTLLGHIETEDATVELVWNVVERLNIEIQ